ncbi:hypothetical protein [Candidatus Palauibacter sp.]
MEAACRRPLDIGALGYGSVKSIRGQDYYAAARNGTSGYGPNRKES